jgi:hypothetical protein
LFGSGSDSVAALVAASPHMINNSEFSLNPKPHN